jgi:hypothetical protein
MKLLILQSSPIFCHFLPLKPKYLPQHSILKHTQRVLRLTREKVLYPYKITGKTVARRY